jgi:hypothetical protein
MYTRLAEDKKAKMQSEKKKEKPVANASRLHPQCNKDNTKVPGDPQGKHEMTSFGHQAPTKRR